MRRLVLVLPLCLPACERAGSGDSTNPDDAAASEGGADGAGEPAPPADGFEVSIINRCAEKWRYYVGPAESSPGGGATAADSVVVPEDRYTFLQPGVSVNQALRPGDVIWLVNRKGESIATGFQSKQEGAGGRVEINPDCETIKRVRLAPPGA